MRKIAIFVGTRPEIIKMAPIIWDLTNHPKDDVPIVHTGQHYDWEMSEQVIRELKIPEPSQFLGVGSGSQGRQLSTIIASAEAYLLKKRIELAVVEGDTNSALGVALAASKNNIKVAHVEAGCRSFDRSMPEEINRILIADCADLNFAPTHNCLENLHMEGIPSNRIFLTGHPIVTLLEHLKGKIAHSNVLTRLHLDKGKYVLATAHRQENVDYRSLLRAILKSLGNLPTTVILPLHPRTKKNIHNYKLSNLLRKLHVTAPLGYLDTLRLIRDADAVVTDSGGIQQEAFLLGTPCLTIRRTTEWTETVENGGNILVKDPSEIGNAYTRLRKERGRIVKDISWAGNIFGDAGSARRIQSILLRKPRSAS